METRLLCRIGRVFSSARHRIRMQSKRTSALSRMLKAKTSKERLLPRLIELSKHIKRVARLSNTGGSLNTRMCLSYCTNRVITPFNTAIPRHVTPVAHTSGYQQIPVHSAEQKFRSNFAGLMYHLLFIIVVMNLNYQSCMHTYTHTYVCSRAVSKHFSLKIEQNARVLEWYPT